MSRPAVVLVLIASLLSFQLFASGCAKTPEDAKRAYKNGDYKTAYQLLKPFAEKGDPDSQFLLGEIYNRGHGVPQDDAKAMNWYRRAAEQGQPNAQNNLGILYFRSQAMKPDYVQAHVWMNIAASNLPVAKERETAVKNRDLVASYMAPSQIAEAEKSAREWKPKMEQKRER